MANLGFKNVGTSRDPTDHTALQAVFKRHPEEDALQQDKKDKKKKVSPKQNSKKQKKLSDRNSLFQSLKGNI